MFARPFSRWFTGITSKHPPAPLTCLGMSVLPPFYRWQRRGSQCLWDQRWCAWEVASQAGSIPCFQKVYTLHSRLFLHNDFGVLKILLHHVLLLNLASHRIERYTSCNRARGCHCQPNSPRVPVISHSPLQLHWGLLHCDSCRPKNKKQNHMLLPGWGSCRPVSFVGLFLFLSLSPPCKVILKVTR